MYICIYINIYIYRRANGIYIQKSCSIWTVCPCFICCFLFEITTYQEHVSVLVVPSAGADLDNAALLDELPGGGDQVDAAAYTLLYLQTKLSRKSSIDKKSKISTKMDNFRQIVRKISYDKKTTL